MAPLFLRGILEFGTMLVSAFVSTVYSATRISLSQRYVSSLREVVAAWRLFVGHPVKLNDYATTLKSYVDPRIVGTRSAVDVLPDPLADRSTPKPTTPQQTPRFRIVG